jgi:hypothetical protein
MFLENMSEMEYRPINVKDKRKSTKIFIGVGFR